MRKTLTGIAVLTLAAAFLAGCSPTGGHVYYPAGKYSGIGAEQSAEASGARETGDGGSLTDREKADGNADVTAGDGAGSSLPESGGTEPGNSGNGEENSAPGNGLASQENNGTGEPAGTSGQGTGTAAGEAPAQPPEGASGNESAQPSGSGSAGGSGTGEASASGTEAGTEEKDASVNGEAASAGVSPDDAEEPASGAAVSGAGEGETVSAGTSSASETVPDSQEQYDFLTSQMYTYAQMESDLERLAGEFAGFMELDSLGETADRRQLYHVVVGPADASKHVLITGSIHAREYITTQLVMRQMEALLRRYRDAAPYEDTTVDELLADTAVHFVPMVNPDGVTISQLGPDGMNLQETKDYLEQIRAMDGSPAAAAYYRVWKSNARGVDLNRNFDAKWELYNDHVGHPSSDHYKSSEVETEAESKALVELTKAYPFVRTVSYHAQGGVIYWYFEQTGELKEENLALAKLAEKETGYWIDSDYTKLDPAGYKDWAISRMGIPSLTIEVGSGSAPVDPQQFEGIWERNQGICEAILYSIR